MAKGSVFRDFLTALQEHWRVALPGVRPVGESLGPTLPRASTFYAGVAEPLGMHVYLHFQHSSKAREFGQFTVNVVLCCRAGRPPVRDGPGFAPLPGDPFAEGSYRIGWLVGERDKWWHLRDDRPSAVTDAWRATSYDDPPAVLTEAVADVTRDVRAVLDRLGVAAARPAPAPGADPGAAD